MNITVNDKAIHSIESGSIIRFRNGDGTLKHVIISKDNDRYYMTDLEKYITVGIPEYVSDSNLLYAFILKLANYKNFDIFKGKNAKLKLE